MGRLAVANRNAASYLNTIASAGLTALLTVAPGVFANAATPDEKTTTTEQGHSNDGNNEPAKTSEQMSEEMKQHLSRIEEVVGDLKEYNENNQKFFGKEIPKDIFGLKVPENTTKDDLNDMLLIIGLFGVIGTSISFIFAAVAGYRANQHRKKLSADITNLENITGKIDDFVRRAEKVNYSAQFNSQYHSAMVHINRTVRLLERRQDRRARLGNFPDLMPYVSARIQSTQDLVVMTVPFYLFGALENPNGIHELHYTIYEHFEDPQSKAELFVITCDDNARSAIARHRYNRSVDALRLIGDRAVTESFLRLFRQDIASVLGEEINDYRNGLKAADRGRIYDLAKMQREWEKRFPVTDQDRQDHIDFDDEKIGNLNFLTYLGTSKHTSSERYVRYTKTEQYSKSSKISDVELFTRVVTLRGALGAAMEEQERLYFSNQTWDKQMEGTPWPKLNTTIIKIDGTLETPENIITLCIDGKEVIECHSDITALKARANKVMSYLGKNELENYRRSILKTFGKSNLSDTYGVIPWLEEIISDNSKFRSPEYDLMRKLGKKAARWRIRDKKTHDQILERLRDTGNIQDPNMEP